MLQLLLNFQILCNNHMLWDYKKKLRNEKTTWKGTLHGYLKKKEIKHLQPLTIDLSSICLMKYVTDFFFQLVCWFIKYKY